MSSNDIPIHPCIAKQTSNMIIKGLPYSSVPVTHPAYQMHKTYIVMGLNHGRHGTHTSTFMVANGTQ